MECPGANVVEDLMSGALDGAARSAVLGHLETCEDCRELVAVTTRDSVTRRPGAQPYPPVVVPGRDLALDATAVPSDIGLDATRLPDDAALDATALPDAIREARAGGPQTIRPSRADSSPGKALGRYTLLERLGAGGMGVVWRADDPKLGRKVALKLLKRHDESLTRRLVLEARAMAQVNHPNVVGVYEVDVADGSTYIAMELVEGKSLRAWQTGARHTVPELVEAYLAAGRGLAAAHAAGIVHRDFKPDNVLVGDDGRVRVTDFGLAAAKPSDSSSGLRRAISDVNLTTSGSVLGTPAYMAPEQFSGGNVDSRTDQFNFCVALYEALYGERPFEGKTFEELGDNVCEGRIKPPPAGTRVSRGLHDILLRGMAVKPGDRFPTMDHVLIELGRDRARPWRRTAIAATAVAAVLLIGLVSDWVVRDRVTGEIARSFETTGKQIARAGDFQAKQFQAAAAFVLLFKSVLDVTSHHDQADFGLATPDEDAAELQHIHDTLISQDWAFVQRMSQTAHPAELAVADYKGRLLYTSFGASEWKGELGAVPAIKHAIDAGRGEFVSVVHYDDPAFSAAKLFGPTPPHGLALMFAHALDHGGDPGGVFLEFVDGKDVLERIRLDDTSLGLVAPDGTTIGEVPTALAIAAPSTGEVAAVASGGATYHVQARTLSDFAGQPIARVVMARPLEGVLSLFPGARTVFAIAALVMLAGALVTALRARRITGARI